MADDFEPHLPQRENALEIGAEKLPVRRGTGDVQYVSADELITERMAERALGKKSHKDCVALYELLDREEDEMLAAPIQPISARRAKALREKVRSLVEILLLELRVEEKPILSSRLPADPQASPFG